MPWVCGESDFACCGILQSELAVHCSVHGPCFQGGALKGPSDGLSHFLSGLSSATGKGAVALRPLIQ